ncbi:GntR family transcriptional regulator [Buttiauxella selenatireducens]|uniref:GntR family transcriptional regulator n=1 Tax=Buttiauxella selenatireducens TaxID=3073902 RepID=A0ABY9S5I1_9ENTR|nr:GntR family transcriptional regulator [Buttiauxella sp. R73]WMY72594.1 GntR family transcriptional regulator [Buttiauxella sp. R73]
MKQITSLERPKSLTTLTCDVLRKEILNGALEMGEALSEVTTAKRLGVSRTPVREAFFQLGIEGLVKTEPQRGTFVFRLDREEMADLCNVRCLLECEALRLVFAKKPQALAKKWKTIVQKMTSALEAGEVVNYLNLDTEFHQVLLTLSTSEYLQQAYTPLNFKITALRNRLHKHSEHLDKGFKEHIHLAQLAAEGKLEEAISVMRSHTLLFDGSYWEYNAGQILPE